MFKVLILILVFITIAWIEASILIQKRLFRELFCFLLLFVTGVGLTIYIYIGTPTSTPLEPIAKLYKPVTKVMEGLFQ